MSLRHPSALTIPETDYRHLSSFQMPFLQLYILVLGAGCFLSLVVTCRGLSICMVLLWGFTGRPFRGRFSWGYRGEFLALFAPRIVEGRPLEDI